MTYEPSAEQIEAAARAAWAKHCEIFPDNGAAPWKPWDDLPEQQRVYLRAIAAASASGILDMLEEVTRERDALAEALGWSLSIARAVEADDWWDVDADSLAKALDVFGDWFGKHHPNRRAQDSEHTP